MTTSEHLGTAAGLVMMLRKLNRDPIGNVASDCFGSICQLSWACVLRKHRRSEEQQVHNPAPQLGIRRSHLLQARTHNLSSNGTTSPLMTAADVPKLEPWSESYSARFFAHDHQAHLHLLLLGVKILTL